MEKTEDRRRMNYYNNVGYDEGWDEESYGDMVQDGYHDTDQWQHDYPAHDEPYNDNIVEEEFIPEQDHEETLQPDKVSIHDQEKNDDVFENFKTGPFPKK